MTAAAERIGRHRAGDYGVGRWPFRGALDDLFDSALAFRPHMRGSEWAERYGWIPKGTGAESGPVTLYGYQRGLLDAMCDPAIPLVTVLKAARVGYTRCATLAVGYHLHQDPTLCAIAQPVEDDAEDFGGSEIAPMLRETPVLAGLLRPVRRGEKQDKATFYQLANGASVRIVGAASDDAFRRYSARFLFADEIDGDGWTPGAKTQGDKLKLFWTRGETFADRKQVRGSTPLIEETSRIWKLWLASNQRRYFVPCPHCSEAAGELDGWQYLDWGGKDTLHGIKWKLDDAGRLADVWYQGTCGCIIDESHKAWMDARGEWRATAEPEFPGHVGFHLWTGMSLNANAAWPVIVQEWIEAQSDPLSLIQPFVNLRLGRPYRQLLGQEIKPTSFLARREAYGDEVPDFVRFLTLGGDVQSGENARIEAAVWGWGVGNESALIGHFALHGDPSEAKVWRDLDALLLRAFRKGDGTEVRIQAAAIDSGGHHTAETYAFCNERRRRRVWAIKGKSETRGSRTKVWPRLPSSKLGASWYMVGGNAARDYAYGSLALADPGPRHVHFPVEPARGSRPIDAEYFEQLTREKLVRRRQGFTEWEKPKAAHEAGVCFVYAYVAVCGLQAMSGRYVALGRMPEPNEAPEATEPPGAPEVSEPAVAEPEQAPEPPPAPKPVPLPYASPPQRQHSAFAAPRQVSGWMSRRRD
ncbi:MAG: terminase gpA endonuclease subunit [Methylorubrum rhodinum]|uniref:terminase gpA endonuclease subunit n=1 Tax=Methylorubrum rhodinum TaxID=29428 RepID=UPI003BB0FD05